MNMKFSASFSEFTLSQDGVTAGMNPTGETTVLQTTVGCPGSHLFIDATTGSCQNPGQDLGKYNLSFVNLSGQDLGKYNLSFVNLSG